MKSLIVERATQDGRCRSCGAAIVWAVTPSGARMPLNPPVVTVPRLDGDDGYIELDRAQTVSHFATCPDASAWRKRHPK